MRAARPTVVHALAPAPFGGLESVVVTLASAQVAAGHRVTVAPVLGGPAGPHPFVDAAEAAGLDVVVVRVGARAYVRERRAIRAVLERTGADVLHTHGYRPDVVDAPVARKAGLTTVSTVHGFTSHDARGRLYEWLQRRAYRSFDAVAAVSGPIAERLVAAGVPSGRVHLVPNAWTATTAPRTRDDARAALDLPASGRIAGWVGRMSPEKAPDLMIGALAACPDPELYLSMVGAGPMLEDVRRLARSEGVEQRVRLHGAIAGAGSLLRAFDVLVLSSWTEGTPMVLLEAISAGVPVVSTAVGGIPDVLPDAAGWLVPAGDVGALGRGMAEAAAGGMAVGARVARARERFERDFAVAPWVERYRALYAGGAA